jgi:signal transduction histidine kinase
VTWDYGVVTAGTEDSEVATTSPEFEPAPKLYRHRTGRVIGGVSGGVAEHLGVRVLWVRATFALLAALGGAGVAAYALLWLLVPQEPAETQEHTQSGRQRQQAVALIVLGAAVALGLSALAGSITSSFALPVIIVIVGAAVVWREADAAQRKRWATGVVGRGGFRGFARVVAGAALVVAGLVWALATSGNLNQTQFVLLAVVAAVIGVVVLTLPWWLRLVRDLGEERRARIRTEERAEIAAHLHDSVLQTLALIQMQSESPREVARLARSQERQLRTWLYGAAGKESGAAEVTQYGSLSQAVNAAAGEVEDTFAIEVEQVVVGDREMDDKLRSMVKAAREAMVNAAKHSGVRQISVYAEVEPEQVAIFVRDRGAGFDPDAVGSDRHGLADSIKGRMARNGGEVKVRTAPGDGTEVQLRLPVSATVA